MLQHFAELQLLSYSNMRMKRPYCVRSCLCYSVASVCCL